MVVAMAVKTELTELTEAELAGRCRARDEDGIRELTRRYNQRLYRIARGILRSDLEAEDVVQDTYIRALAGLEGFRGSQRLARGSAHRHQRSTRAPAPKEARGARRAAGRTRRRSGEPDGHSRIPRDARTCDRRSSGRISIRLRRPHG